MTWRDRLRRGIAAGIAVAAIGSGFVAPPDGALAKGKGDSGEEKPAPPPKIKVGDVAPDFTLKNQKFEDVTLRDFRGKKTVVLAFYAFAFSGG